VSKNDVEMVISVKDQTGNGIDSARQKFGELSKTIGGGSGGSGSGGLVNTTIKLGAAVAGLNGGFKLAAAGVSAFQGDADAAQRMIESLPLGIGGVIKSMRELAEAFSVGQKRARAFAEASNEIGEQFRQDRFRIDMMGQSGVVSQLAQIDERMRVELRNQEKENRKQVADDIKSMGRDQAFALFEQRQQRLEIIKAGYAREKELAEQAARIQNEIGIKQAEDRIKEINRANEEQTRLELQEAYKRQRMLANISDIGAAQQFRTAADFANILSDSQSGMQAEFAAIDAAIRQARGGGGGASQLASGEQNRFGTGLVASARESSARMANETAKNTKDTVDKLEKIRKLLEDANKPPAVPGINLEVLEGLS
jgi:hypothetical protein